MKYELYEKLMFEKKDFKLFKKTTFIYVVHVYT